MMPAKLVTRRRTFTMIALAVVWGYTAFILAWWLGRWAWGDQVWLLAVLNSFPTWLFAPLPLVVGLAALSRRRMAWGVASAPVILWLVLFGWRFLPQTQQAGATGAELRVMAFNLLATNTNYDAILEVIAQAEPDIIALPELSVTLDGVLAHRLGDRYPYRTRQTLSGAYFGTGIYSRWPLTPLGSLKTGLGLRSAAADIETPGGMVRFVALHPNATYFRTDSWHELGESISAVFRHREKQVEAVCRYLDDWSDQQVILAGDFNMTEFSDAYRCIAERLDDGFRTAGRGHGYTWPSQTPALPPWSYFDHWPELTRIDYVFYSRHWRAVDAVVLKTPTGSDHRPVVATLRWMYGE